MGNNNINEPVFRKEYGEYEKERLIRRMGRIEEIKEALDSVDYPEHEFRGYCYELLGMLEIAEKALYSVVNAPSREHMRNYADKALEQIRGDKHGKD